MHKFNWLYLCDLSKIPLAILPEKAYTPTELEIKEETFMGGNVMKLVNIHEVEEFRKVIHECEGNVLLKSQEGDVFNLKSAMSEYIALGRLLGEQGDSLELFADRREDEARLLNFLNHLDKENGTTIRI